MWSPMDTRSGWWHVTMSMHARGPTLAPRATKMKRSTSVLMRTSSAFLNVSRSSRASTTQWKVRLTELSEVLEPARTLPTSSHFTKTVTATRENRCRCSPATAMATM